MGKYEEQLKTIATAQDWSVPMLKGFERTLPDLSDLMRKLAGATGLTGAAAEAAKQSFLSLQDGFDQLHENVVALNRSIESANRLRSDAAQEGLPSATLDPAAHAAILVAGTVVVPGLGTLAAEGGIQLYENFLRGQREDAAHESLEKLQSALADQSLSVRHVKEFNPSTPTTPESTDANWPGPRSYGPTFNPGGGGYPGPDSGYAGLGGGGSSGSSGGSDWESGGSNSGGDHTTPSVDGDLGGGYVPGSGGPGGANGGGLPFRPGGGLGGGLLGGAGGAAALAVGARLGSSGMAGTGGGLGGAGSVGGAGANPGAGGLLGGSRGAVGAAGEGAAGSGAAGGRPGGAMMGGGQGGAGGSEKEKRSGLGGPMAPKFEDDEERGPRSAGAMAGGRETPVSN